MNNVNLLRYKGDKCVHCGTSREDIIKKHGVCYRSFAFHHIDEEKKDKNYNNIIRRKLSLDQLIELDKCALLCNMCHGTIHGQKINAKVNLEIKFNERLIKKRLIGQIVCDLDSGKLTFITDSFLDLNIYTIKIGSDSSYEIIGFEMNDKNFKENLLNDAVTHKQISIYNNNSQLIVMTIQSIGGNKLHISQDISFYFCTIETSLKGYKKNFFSVHNGVAINSNSQLIDSGVINYQVELQITPKNI